MVAEEMSERFRDPERLDGSPLPDPNEGKNPHAMALGKPGGAVYFLLRDMPPDAILVTLGRNGYYLLGVRVVGQAQEDATMSRSCSGISN